MAATATATATATTASDGVFVSPQCVSYSEAHGCGGGVNIQ
jgi:hypothetical protein